MKHKVYDSPAWLALIAHMHTEKGMSAAEIGRELGADNQTVQRRLEGMGIYQRKYGSSFDDLPIEHIYARYQDGESLPGLADEFGVHYGSLHRYLKNNGYQIDTVSESYTRRGHVSPIEFVAAWQQSGSLNEVVEKLGMKKSAISARAAVLQCFHNRRWGGVE
jgi:hypothetical protein